MTDIAATDCLQNWLNGVAATGDFYCPAELTIPTGSSGIPSGWTRHNYEDELYLNFTMPNGGDITLTKNGSPTEVTLEYLLEGTPNWITWTESSNVRTITLTAGQKVFIRNTSETQTSFSVDASNYYQFAFTGTVETHGNINSLLCKNAESVISLTSFCYAFVFNACTSLITAPNLPANTLADYCYYRMFQNCTSLTTAPELPSTTLVQSCYAHMFRECTSLIVAPELPANTLVAYCYYAMFHSCTSLRDIRTQMTDISASSCIDAWLSNTSPTGDFYCPAELTIPTGASGIPSGWTRHDI